jgi:soluble lytic murein transglycosylase-like protein
VSRAGAVGLMQVMRFHAGAYDCGSRNLKEIDANVCHGAHVLNDYLQASPDVRQALLRYNGCVRGGRHARRCERYPGRVLRNASRLQAAMGKKGR